MRPKHGPVGKPLSSYAGRQARRFQDQGFKLPEIAQRLGVTQHDVRKLLKAYKATPTAWEIEAFAPRPLPTIDRSGRSYEAFPLKRRFA